MIKWNPFFQLFLQSVDRKTGSFLHMPFEGGVMNQPSKTMTILMILQEEYLSNLLNTIKR